MSANYRNIVILHAYWFKISSRTILDRIFKVVSVLDFEKITEIPEYYYMSGLCHVQKPLRDVPSTGMWSDCMFIDSKFQVEQLWTECSRSYLFLFWENCRNTRKFRYVCGFYQIRRPLVDLPSNWIWSYCMSIDLKFYV